MNGALSLLVTSTHFSFNPCAFFWEHSWVPFPAFPASRCGHVSTQPIARGQKRSLPVKTSHARASMCCSRSAVCMLMSRVLGSHLLKMVEGRDTINLGLRKTLLSKGPFPFPTCSWLWLWMSRKWHFACIWAFLHFGLFLRTISCELTWFYQVPTRFFCPVLGIGDTMVTKAVKIPSSLLGSNKGDKQ